MEREYQPDFDAEERARAAEPRRKFARDMALALLKQHRIAKPEVNVEALARECGLSVAYVDVDGKLSGQLYADLREIAVNTRSRSRARQRFTLAHELGHWQLLHHTLGELPPDTLGYSGAFEDEGSREGRSAVEVEANTFASELLMPSPWIRKIPKPLIIGAPSVLAQTYGVSEQAMFYQLMRCGRLTYQPASIISSSHAGTSPRTVTSPRCSCERRLDANRQRALTRSGNTSRAMPKEFVMSNLNETKQEVASGVAARAASPERGGDAAKDRGGKPAHDVQVHVDYISADDPIHREFPSETTVAAVKQWAREQFVPQPPSDKAYYLNDDKTRHRFTADEEQQTLAQRGYEKEAHFRLNEEQAAGSFDISARD